MTQIKEELPVLKTNTPRTQTIARRARYYEALNSGRLGEIKRKQNNYYNPEVDGIKSPLSYAEEEILDTEREVIREIKATRKKKLNLELLYDMNEETALKMYPSLSKQEYRILCKEKLDAEKIGKNPILWNQLIKENMPSLKGATSVNNILLAYDMVSRDVISTVLSPGDYFLVHRIGKEENNETYAEGRKAVHRANVEKHLLERPGIINAGEDYEKSTILVQNVTKTREYDKKIRVLEKNNQNTEYGQKRMMINAQLKNLNMQLINLDDQKGEEATKLRGLIKNLKMDLEINDQKDPIFAAIKELKKERSKQQYWITFYRPAPNEYLLKGMPLEEKRKVRLKRRSSFPDFNNIRMIEEFLKSVHEGKDTEYQNIDIEYMVDDEYQVIKQQMDPIDMSVLHDRIDKTPLKNIYHDYQKVLSLKK